MVFFTRPAMFGPPQNLPRSPGLFRLRNLLGGALVIGVISGIWLGDMLPGLGTGGGVGIGVGNTGIMGTPTGQEKNAEFNVGKEHVDKSTGKSLRVIIEDWNYLVRSNGKDVPITLDELVQQVTKLKGDADGVRLRVYRTESARATAEHKLQEALKAAHVPDAAVYIAPDVVE